MRETFRPTATVRTARAAFVGRLRGTLGIADGAPLPELKRSIARASDGGSEYAIAYPNSLVHVANAWLFLTVPGVVSLRAFMRAGESSRRQGVEHLNGSVTHQGLGSRALPPDKFGPNDSTERQQRNARYAQDALRARLRGKQFSGEQIVTVNTTSFYDDTDAVRRFLHSGLSRRTEKPALAWQWG